MADFNRNKFEKKVKQSLEGISESEVRCFALRTSLHLVLNLRKFEVTGDEESRRFFYALWLSLGLSVVKVYGNDDFSKAKSSYAAADADADVYAAYADAAYTAAAAVYATTTTADANADAAAAAVYAANAEYTAVINYIEQDLKLLKEKKSLQDVKLFHSSTEKISLKYFEDINPLYKVWTEYILKAAIDGTLKEKSKLLTEAFLEVNKEGRNSDLFTEKPLEFSNQMLAHVEGNIEESKYARVILLGSGGAGKTSLVKNIKESGSASKSEERTPRIEISRLTTKEETLVDIWDFGGQVIMHSTHSFFLSSHSIYVVVCNHRLDEQPDSWLDFVKTRVKEGSRHRVLVVYTHCDTQEEISRKNFSRENRLKRLYEKDFEIEYFALSNTKIDESEFENFFKKFTERFNEVVEAEGKSDSISFYKKMYDAHKKNINSYDELVALKKSLKLKTTQLDDGFIESMLTYGYVFKSSPSATLQNNSFIWQKHWLTYGVYGLINSEITREQNGKLKRSDFDAILNKDKKKYINLETGEVSGASKGGYEELLYEQEGINLLYEVVQNYNWAIKTNDGSGEIVFPHAVKLDEPENLFTKYVIQESDETYRRLEVVFEVLPKDFFFRFVALSEKHIIHETLFRTGVVLADPYDEKTIARVMMEGNRMQIESVGKYNVMLMQFVSSFVIMILRDSNKVKAQFLQGVKVNGEVQMVDTQLMETDTKLLQEEINKLKKESSVSNTYNTYINGNNNNTQVGERNIMHIRSEIKKSLEHLKSLEQTAEVQELVREGEVLENVDISSQSGMEKAEKYAKRLTVFDKAQGALYEHGEGIVNWIGGLGNSSS